LIAVDATEASRTAVLVCQGRAVADGRLAPNRFRDPTAIAFLRTSEAIPVAQVRAGDPPSGFGERIEFEMVQASAEVMVPRTVAIDDALREHVTPQLVILGAGLDGRAWRIDDLASVEVFEVDHPASQRDKRGRVADLPTHAKSLHFVPVDFTRDDLDGALESAGHQETVPTTWIWEGVVPYLTRTEVDATVRVVADRSDRGSRLIVNYQTPSLSAAAGRAFARALALIGRRPDPLAREARRSSWTPEAMRARLGRYGLHVVRDTDLLTLAERLPMAVRHRRSLRTGHIAVADR
jgi:methyltransferase (TIGR00027 family)